MFDCRDISSTSGGRWTYAPSAWVLPADFDPFMHRHRLQPNNHAQFNGEPQSGGCGARGSPVLPAREGTMLA